jgi:poly-beta-1,6-N-acetyl-D-glucosamine N-deacetylase
MKRDGLVLIWLFLFVLTFSAGTEASSEAGRILVLCYHSVPHRAVSGDDYGVTQGRFVEQMEYLRTHGYRVVSLQDVIEAKAGKGVLPERAVLLTFDDAYASFHQFVYPVLKRFGFPSVLAVVGEWIESPPRDLPEPTMSWNEIRQVARDGLVDVASHSYDLHRAIQYNPQGNVGAAVSVRAFLPRAKRYESDGEYAERLRLDFRKQKQVFEEKLGFAPRVMVWPYGRYNQASVKIAEEEGYGVGFTLEEGFGDLSNLQTINRVPVRNGPMSDFIAQVKRPGGPIPFMRAVQVDLDLVFDPTSAVETDRNLGLLIERLNAIKVNTVFLQAFSDPEGTGNIREVYFPNRVLPVRADIFSHAAHQMMIRGMKVYAWMPTLSLVLPNDQTTAAHRVLEFAEGEIRESRSWYSRLTPFSREVQDAAGRLYEDLAVHSQIHGILFQDDAYLTDREDYHPAALAQYHGAFGREISESALKADQNLAMKWARFKTERLVHFTKDLEARVRRYRPEARFARNLYARVLMQPASEEWFSQNYEVFLDAYDYVVVMVYPALEDVKNPYEWIREMVRSVKGHDGAIERTVFKLQAYDWGSKVWIGDAVLREQLREVLASGGRHLAYYPDNFWQDRPSLKTIKIEMSTETFPFAP